MSGEERVIELFGTGEDRAAEDVPIIQENGTAPDLPERVKLNEDGSYTLPFLFPVTLRYKNSAGDTVREEAFEELRLHRLKGKDLIAVNNAGAKAAQVAIACSARINGPKFAKVFEEMDGEDISAAGEVVAFFLGSGRRTGR